MSFNSFVAKQKGPMKEVINNQEDLLTRTKEEVCLYHWLHTTTMIGT